MIIERRRSRRKNMFYLVLESSKLIIRRTMRRSVEHTNIKHVLILTVEQAGLQPPC